ncbi:MULTISPECIES: IS66 family insertion sequence element accessory protein TnpB [Blautia]|uniref:IS66 family insertion sequence element accessory protein TnpB n=1 Tax=Blautia TaxID=572511 RepID=UPI00338FDAA5
MSASACESNQYYRYFCHDRNISGLCDNPHRQWNRPCHTGLSSEPCERHSVLGDISVADNIYIVCSTTDMRKSIDDFCSIVQDKLFMDSYQSSLFLFCGKRCDRIKVLLHEPDGYVLLYKRLNVAQGRYRWPRKSSDEPYLNEISRYPGRCVGIP